MKKNRLIPVLLLRNGFIVQSKGFSRYQAMGDPTTIVRRLSNWASDELIYLDISRDDTYDLKRDDLAHPNRDNILDIIKDVSCCCQMPITFGGKIRTIADIALRLANGADKVCINTKPLQDPFFITAAAKEFGSQCLIVSVDVKLIDGRYHVFSHGGREATPYQATQWAHIVQEQGAGEILINSIDRDGTRQGFDIELIGQVSDAVRIPVIALGGAGEWPHFGDPLAKTKADAVAAANIFHYYDQSVYIAKKWLFENGFNVRPPDLLGA